LHHSPIANFEALSPFSCYSRPAHEWLAVLTCDEMSYSSGRFLAFGRPPSNSSPSRRTHCTSAAPTITAPVLPIVTRVRMAGSLATVRALSPSSGGVSPQNLPSALSADPLHAQRTMRADLRLLFTRMAGALSRFRACRAAKATERIFFSPPPVVQGCGSQQNRRCRLLSP